MCTLCAMTQTFDPVRHDSESLRAEYNEIFDAEAGVSTIYSMAAGDSFQGSVSLIGDEDWVRLSLEDGKRYEVTLTGIDGGGGTLSDPFLTLYDQTGDFVSSNDDYTSRDSSLTFTVEGSTFFYASAGGFDDAVGSYRLDVREVSQPNLDETSDAPSGTGTTYSVAVGATFTGEIDTNSDVDWVRVMLTAGESYTIGVSGIDGGGGTLSDPYLAVYDSGGSVLDSDDAGGIQFDSELGFTPTQSGAYYIVASGVAGAIGTYTIRVTSGNVPPPGGGDTSLDQMAEYLTDGYWQDRGSARRSFNTVSDNEMTVDLDALTAGGRQLARWALEAWEMVADLSFREVSVGADIVFDDNESGAFASSRMSGGRILDAEVNVSTDWVQDFGDAIDDYTFSTYIHEIGHALGLGHQGDYNGNAVYGQDETFSDDSWQVSVMSYFSQADNTSVSASEATPISTMMTDIIAIQTLYGTPDTETSATAGATVWGAGSTLDGYWGDYFAEIAGEGSSTTYDGGTVSFTIYDVSGMDLVDLSFSGGNDRIDMRAEQFSDVDGLIGNVGIARQTVIENLIAGAGNDTITGNDVANSIDGAAGADTIKGGLGDDTLQGGGGADTLDGEAGADYLEGGLGDDNLTGGDGADTVQGGAGSDSIYGNSGVDFIEAGDGHDFVSGGFSTDEIHGNGGRDELQGRSGADTLYGGAGDDSLYGSQGIDELHGGDDDDEMYGATASDMLYGDGGNDTMYGSQGRDELHGGEGRDSMSGGTGADTLYGDGGNDKVYGNASADTAYGGAGDDSLYGGTGADELSGDAGNDLLAGQKGGDTLTGGAGNDTLRGGELEDVFVFDTGFDADVIEDFSLLEDRLQFSVALTGGLTDGAAIVAAFADDSGAALVFDFGGGDQVTFEAITTADGFASQIDII